MYVDVPLWNSCLTITGLDYSRSVSSPPLTVCFFKHMTCVCYCYSSQKYTIPSYVSFKGTNLPNHSYVNLTLVGGAKDGNGSVQYHTDLSTCRHADDDRHHGDWYFSNGTQLPLPSINSYIFNIRQAQQVDL